MKLGLCVFITSFFLLFGLWKEKVLSDFEKKGEKVVVGAVQPNMRGDGETRKEIYDVFFNLSKKLANDAKQSNQELDIIVWPELPIWFLSNDQFGKFVKYYTQNLLTDKTAFMYVAGYIGNEFDEFKMRVNYNNAFFQTPHIVHNQRQNDFYTKQYLFPFGEYIPFFWNYPGNLRVQLYNMFSVAYFSVGKEKKIFHLNDKVRIIPPICYEGIMSKYILDFKKKGSNMILVGSNDMWYGYGVTHDRNRYSDRTLNHPIKKNYEKVMLDATKQSGLHFYLTLFRAIENRVPVVRVTNSGISGYVDVFGRYKNLSKNFIRDTAIYSVSVLQNYGPTVFERFANYYPFITLSILVLIYFISRYIYRYRSFMF